MVGGCGAGLGAPLDINGGGGGGGGGDGTIESKKLLLINHPPTDPPLPGAEGGVAVPIEVAALLLTLPHLSKLPFFLLLPSLLFCSFNCFYIPKSTN